MIIALAVGSLGAIPTQFGNILKQIGITVGTTQVRKTVLLGRARILRKVLQIYGYWLWLDFNNIFRYTFTLCQLNNNNNNKNNNKNNNNKNNNNNFPKTRKYWVDVQWGIVSSHGERDPL